MPSLSSAIVNTKVFGLVSEILNLFIFINVSLSAE